MGPFNRGARGGNRSFGDHQRGGRGGNRSFGGIQKPFRGGHQNRSFGGESRGRGGFKRGGNFRGGNRGSGGRNSFGNDGNRSGGFFKKQNGFQGDKPKKDFSFQDNRKRKFGSDSEDDEIIEKPKSILKTPRLDDITKSGKKKVTMHAANNSFQAKTPSTPHPAKNKPSIGATPSLKKDKVIKFDSSDEDSDDEEETTPAKKAGGKASLKDLLNDSAEDEEELDDEDELESYEDFDGESEDGLEEIEDEDLAKLGGAEDSEEDEMDLEDLEQLEESTDESEDEEETTKKPAKAEKPATEKPAAKTEKPAAKAAAEANGKPKSNLPPAAAQAEQKSKLSFFKTAYYVANPSNQIQQRKNLGTIHPFLTGVWKHGKGLLLVFDSEKNREKAAKWFAANQQPEIRDLKLVKAEEEKSLLEDAPGKADLSKLQLLHIPERINKQHLKAAFPNAEAIDMPTGGAATIVFKSADEAQKELNGLGDFRLFGARVLVTFQR